MSLTAQLCDSKNAVRQFMDGWFPLARWDHPFRLPGTVEFLRQHNSQAFKGPPIRPGTNVRRRLLGTAIDFRIRHYFAHVKPDDLLTRGSVRGSDVKAFLAAVGETTTRINPALRQLPELDENLLNACCYLLAVLEHAKKGPVSAEFVSQPWPQELNPDSLLQLVPEEARDDLSALSSLFWKSSQPILEAVRKGLLVAICGPRFGIGGRLTRGAVADLILTSTLEPAAALIDIKALIPSRLTRRHLFQLLGYALLDWDDAYSIDKVGFYMARTGDWMLWSADELLNYLGDGARILGTTRRRTLSLAEWRSRFREAVENADYLAKRPAMEPLSRQQRAVQLAERITADSADYDPCALCGDSVDLGWRLDLSRTGTLLCPRCYELAHEFTSTGRLVLGL